MPHLVLLGDAIFDNASYTRGGPCVIEQITARLPAGWSASLLAVDGDTTSDVAKQLSGFPTDASHLALSVGGNDALGCMSRLEEPVHTVLEALATLADIQSGFARHYGTLLDKLAALKLPLMTCTIYDAVPGLPVPLRAALSLFNDVILREAIRRGLPVLDLRMVCTEPGDYSEDSPFEPSSQGGAKLADRLASTVLHHDFKRTDCSIGR